MEERLDYDGVGVDPVVDGVREALHQGASEMVTHDPVAERMFGKG